MQCPGEGWGRGCAEKSRTNLDRGRLNHSMRGHSLDEASHHVHGGRSPPLNTCHDAHAEAGCVRRRGIQ
eukprot:5609584-Pyramimonas_sp.AAC.1